MRWYAKTLLLRSFLLTQQQPNKTEGHFITTYTILRFAARVFFFIACLRDEWHTNCYTYRTLHSNRDRHTQETQSRWHSFLFNYLKSSHHSAAHRPHIQQYLKAIIWNISCFAKASHSEHSRPHWDGKLLPSITHGEHRSQQWRGSMQENERMRHIQQTLK